MLYMSFLSKLGHINTCFCFFFLKGLGVKGQQVPFSVSNQAEAAVQV